MVKHAEAALLIVCPGYFDRTLVCCLFCSEPIGRCQTGLDTVLATDMQAAGEEEWWKLREAALLAVGSVADPLLEAPGSSDRDFDLASFLNSCLAEDLSASTPPYLLGRALWVASRYGRPGRLPILHSHTPVLRMPHPILQ